MFHVQNLQMKAAEQNFPAVLFIMLYKVDVISQTPDIIPKNDYSCGSNA